MKNKKLLLLCVGLLMTTQMIFAQVPSYVPSNGLVVYYPFTGNANEVIQNSNNGVINGATLTFDKNGVANNAYSFNGINNYIDLPSNFYGGQNASIVSFCLRFKVTTNGDYFIWNKDGSWLEAGIYTRTNGKFGIFWAFPNQYNGIETTIGTILPNTWYDAIIIVNGGNSKIYLNGVEQSNLTINIPSNSIGFGDAGTCGIGINRFGFKKTSCAPGEYFNGVLDEFYFYDRIITQNEITTMYNGSQTSGYSDTCNNVSGSLTQGLVGYWPFCGNANDDSGNGNNGTVNGATLTTDRFGNSNSAYLFDNNSRIKINYNNSLTSQTGSISSWIYLNSLPPANDPQDLIFGKGWGYPQLVIRDNGKVYLHLLNSESTSTYIESTSSLNIGSWNHVLVSYSVDNFKIYINGILQNSITPNPSPNYFSYCNSDYWIGGFNHQNSCMPNDNVQNFDGKIDDIGIWNRVLSQAEVTQLYNQNQCFTNTTVTDTLIINVGQLSFNDPVTWANNISIAPNPASTEININFNNITDLNGGTIKIINSLGQQVATTPITATGTNTTMALNSWGGNGLYFVQIINAQGIVVDVKKIILQ